MTMYPGYRAPFLSSQPYRSCEERGEKANPPPKEQLQKKTSHPNQRSEPIERYFAGISSVKFPFSVFCDNAQWRFPLKHGCRKAMNTGLRAVLYNGPGVVAPAPFPGRFPAITGTPAPTDIDL
jgi:hypothetical protein